MTTPLSLPVSALKALPGAELTDAGQVLKMGKPRPESEDQGWEPPEATQRHHTVP